jgi:cytochrome c-type biogenesis protein CcmH
MKWLALILCLLAAPLAAVQPDEVLDDPALELRARALSAELRCPVCRNESIDESHADIARDLRLMLRERLVAGDSDAQAMQFLVDRYGPIFCCGLPHRSCCCWQGQSRLPLSKDGRVRLGPPP